MDQLDRQILEVLLEDGRTPFTQIARQTGVSETTVRARYQAMVEDDILRIVGIVDPSALSYRATAIVAVTVEPGLTDRIARTLASLPEVSHLVHTLGSYDLILELFCRDLVHLTDVVTKQVHSVPGVRATETLMIAKSYKPLGSWSPVLGTDPDLEDP